MKSLIIIILSFGTVLSGLTQEIGNHSEILTDTIIDFPDKEAEFPGGMEEMYKHLFSQIEYPKTNPPIHSFDKIFVEFIIDKNGEVFNASILNKSEHPASKSVLKAVNSMPRWTPAEHKGKKVYQRFKLPIKFHPE